MADVVLRGLLSIQEVAKLSACKPGNVYKAIRLGRLRAIRPMADLRVRPSDLEDWWESAPRAKAASGNSE